jgi:3-hydroxyisobutyrate dehydrogenase-like beta-hydroxyacid dehydrogenase
METIGLIGIGLLGSALAERFLRAGFAVAGHDVRAEARQHLDEMGGQGCSSTGEVAQRSARIVLCLPDSDAVRTVLTELKEELTTRHIFIDTTTGDPDVMARTGGDFRDRDIAYVDAGVLGSSEQVRSGEAIVMAGGEARIIEDNSHLFRCFCKQWYHVGSSGAGARMKLVVNLVLGLNRAVLAEGLAFAGAVGLEPALALEILRCGVAYSRVMDTKGSKMLAGDYRPQARLAQHLKDVRLILEQAGRAGARVPLSETHRTLLERAVELGSGEEDNSAVLRVYLEEARPTS